MKNKKRSLLRETFGIGDEIASDFDSGVLTELRPQITNEIEEFLYSMDPTLSNEELVQDIMFHVSESLELSDQQNYDLSEDIFDIVDKTISSDKTSDEIVELILQKIGSSLMN